ncbi:MAG: hypothetical protein FJZ58_05845 [Chlamydiae bacterium]|nr:hypothetical protein [Chlamydiota bacterium]
MDYQASVSIWLEAQKNSYKEKNDTLSYAASSCLKLIHTWHSASFALYAYCTGYEDPLSKRIQDLQPKKHISDID